MIQSGGTVVMTLPYTESTATSQQYQPTPHNFSRPNPRPTSSSNAVNGHTLNGAPSNGVNGYNGSNHSQSQDGIQSKPFATANNIPQALPQERDSRFAYGAKDSIRASPRPSADGSNITSNSEMAPGQSAVGSSGVNGRNRHPHELAMRSKSTEHLSHVSTMPSAPRQASPAAPGSAPTGGQQQQQHASGPGSLRQRHTLQVPKPQGNRPTASASGSDAGVNGQLSPTPGHAPRRGSMSLARRPTRSITSENHVDEIPPDEDAAKWAEAIKAKRASKRKKEEETEDDKVVVGTKVDHTHVNWITAYNMLTGIRFVVSRINAKMDRPLTDVDFDAKHKFSFDITGNELTPSAKYDFKFKDYSPWVFRHLRTKFGLDPADYLMSLTSKYILSELGSPGKSGSFFYFSRDYKYIIKTIHHGEHRFLRKILRDYYQHIEENPNTLISQFYGLHRVKTAFGRKIHFVVMNNLFPPHRDIHQTFDLKGSTIGRDFREEDLEANPRAVMKDLNWLRRDMHLNFGPNKKDLFIQQVERDVKLLQKLGIMDYSLLLGIHDLTRGNRDDIRNSALKVFQPGGAEGDDMQGHILQRTPSKMEKARQAQKLRKTLNTEVPVTLDMNEANRLPEEFLEQKNTIFYEDDGGFRATHENEDPGDVIYYLGIIDCLTHYGFLKRMEHFWRGLSNDKDKVSAIPPHNYGDRFFNFIRTLVKSPEEVAREKEATESRGAEPMPSSELGVRDEQPTTEEERCNPRSFGTIRSPSAERTGGAAGTILPVVEEAGEGSTSGRSRNHSSSGSGSDHSAHSVEQHHDSVHHAEGTEMTTKLSGRSYVSKPDSAISIDEPTSRHKRAPEQEQPAIRMAGVSR